MRKYRNLFLVVFTLLVLLPINVFAEEFNKVEITLDQPVVGKKPAEVAKVKYSNEINSIEYTYDLSWYIQDKEDYNTRTLLTSDELINNDNIYYFSYEEDKFINVGHTLANEYDKYINDIKLPEHHINIDLQYFYIGGLIEEHIYLDEPIAGKTPDHEVEIILKTNSKSYEFTVKPEWEEIDNNYYTTLEETDKFKVGKQYTFSVTLEEETFIKGKYEDFLSLFDKVDFRTKTYINGTEVNPYGRFTYGPLEEQVKIIEKFSNIVDSMSVDYTTKGEEYSTTLFADLDYKLPDDIIVKIGNKTLDNKEYSYDSKTGELLIPASLVTDDITIEATAISTLEEEIIEKPSVNNPDTSDNIIIYIILGLLSITGIITISILYKKSNKLGA